LFSTGNPESELRGKQERSEGKERAEEGNFEHIKKKRPAHHTYYKCGRRQGNCSRMRITFEETSSASDGGPEGRFPTPRKADQTDGYMEKGVENSETKTEGRRPSSPSRSPAGEKSMWDLDRIEDGR